MKMKKILTESSWENVLGIEFQKPYFMELKNFLRNEIIGGKSVLPPPLQILNAFNYCSFSKIKVVIIGQDPYHGADQAHGLCFSVNKEVRIPPSLKNIYKELQTDLGVKNFQIPNHGNLEDWAKRGVLLLNSTLTVEQSKPTSHFGKGWEKFTNEVISKISDQKENVVFLLWGNFAKSKSSLIDSQKHLILTAAHPSPLSAYSGFFGCKHFSRTNEFLKKKGLEEIDWRIV
jgi:uracil-DNA glycosylase